MFGRKLVGWWLAGVIVGLVVAAGSAAIIIGTGHQHFFPTHELIGWWLFVGTFIGFMLTTMQSETAPPTHSTFLLFGMLMLLWFGMNKNYQHAPFDARQGMILVGAGYCFAQSTILKMARTNWRRVAAVTWFVVRNLPWVLN